MAAEAGQTVAPGPTALVRTAVEALEREFFEPLAVPDLLRDADRGSAGEDRAPLSGGEAIVDDCAGGHP